MYVASKGQQVGKLGGAVKPGEGWAQGALSTGAPLHGSQHGGLRGIRLLTWGLQELIQQTSRSLLRPALVSGKGHGPHLVREESQNVFILCKIRLVLVYLSV